MENIIKKTQDRIAELLKEKEQAINVDNDALIQIAAQIEAENTAAEDAAAVNDPEAFRAARAKIVELTSKAEYHRAHLRRYGSKEIVSEKESEDTIAALLRYEGDLESEFKRKAGELLIQLKALVDEQYMAALDAENTIREWTSKIRPNYVSTSTTYSATGTNKNVKPVPVHPFGYFGGAEVAYIDNFLKVPMTFKIMESAKVSDAPADGDRQADCGK